MTRKMSWPPLRRLRGYSIPAPCPRSRGDGQQIRSADRPRRVLWDLASSRWPSYRGWNWQSAVFSSLLRATIFFFTNMVVGWHAALVAMATGRRHRRIGSCGVMRVWVEYIGSLAAACTTLCWAPQAVKIIREKQTRGISLLTQAVFTVGLALWLAYGILITNWPLMISNAVTLVFALLILILKVRYR